MKFTSETQFEWDTVFCGESVSLKVAAALYKLETQGAVELEGLTTADMMVLHSANLKIVPVGHTDNLDTILSGKTNHPVYGKWLVYNPAKTML